MIGICLVILCVIAGLFITYKNEQKEVFDSLPKKGNELKIFYPVSFGILRLLKRWQISASKESRAKAIENLNMVTEIKETELLFNIRRVAYLLAILSVTGLLGLLYGISLITGNSLASGKIMRPDYGKGEESISMLANDKEINVTINSKKFCVEEIQENFRKAYEKLLPGILNENNSLDEVQDNLYLPTYLEMYDIKITWMSDKVEIIDPLGSVHNEDFTEEMREYVTLSALMSCDDMTCQYDFYTCVIPKQLDENEKVIKRIIASIRKNDLENPYEEYVILPSEIDGEIIEYKEIRNKDGYLLIILGIICGICIFVGMDKDLEKKAKEREQQMLMDYSEIVSKLNILMQAGMSILMAWEKIIDDYSKLVMQGKMAKRFAYEEMTKTYYEIKQGIPEQKAYLEFGKRCNVHEYLKLGSLISQNIKKGSRGLAKMLETESTQAFENRINLAKKLGEEAGTKMLIPMIMMLAIVMIIVLVPAFTSFSL